MALCGAPDMISKHPSHGHGVHWISDQARAWRAHLSESDRWLTCRHVDASRASDLHRTGKVSRKHGLCFVIVGQHMDASRALDLHRTSLIKGNRGPRHGPGFLRFRVIRRLYFHHEMDVPHRLRNCPYKNRCISLLFWTFDRFVKQLSEFEWRSWVHHDSLAIRLDHDPIKAEFVVINQQISSNIPLECQISVEEETAQIHFNPRELKPHLNSNQVSNEIRSIIWW